MSSRGRAVVGAKDGARRSKFAMVLGFRVFLLATAAPLIGASAEPAADRSASGPAQSLQMLSPGPTGVSTHNQREGPAPYTVAISDEAAQVLPGKQTFRGVAKGMRNVAVVCPAGGEWRMVQPAEDGSFSVEVDIPDVTGPTPVDVFSWDSPPNDPNYRASINARVDLFVVGSPRARAEAALPPGHPAAGMRLVWSDEFDGPLSVSGSRHRDATWFMGGKPSATGSQYSDAFFVSATDRRDPFYIKDGFLRIRATHTYPEPGRPGPSWWSGHLSTGFPDESASIEFRRGYAEVRMKTPLGQGAWPAFWLLDSASTLPSRPYGAVEIDAVEAYGHDITFYMATQHRWPGAERNEPYAHNQKGVDAGNIANGFNRYGVKLTDAEVVWFFNGTEVHRAPLFRHDVVSPFFIMLDLAMGGGWPIVSPPAGYYDLWVDYVRVYE